MQSLVSPSKANALRGWEVILWGSLSETESFRSNSILEVQFLILKSQFGKETEAHRVLWKKQVFYWQQHKLWEQSIWVIFTLKHKKCFTGCKIVFLFTAADNISTFPSDTFEQRLGNLDLKPHFIQFTPQSLWSHLRCRIFGRFLGPAVCLPLRSWNKESAVASAVSCHTIRVNFTAASDSLSDSSKWAFSEASSPIFLGDVSASWTSAQQWTAGVQGISQAEAKKHVDFRKLTLATSFQKLLRHFICSSSNMHGQVLFPNSHMLAC